MKNKKFTIGLTLLLTSTLLLTNCTKNKTNEPPVADNNTQSTADVVELQMILSDIIELAGQGHDATGISPYLSSTLTAVKVGTTTVPSNPVSPNVQTIPKYYNITFANTPGNDGHLRNGVLNYDYSTSTSTVPIIVHSTPGFIANVTSTAYTIDNYSVNINSMTIKNMVQPGFPLTAGLTPTNVNLSWDINANVTVTSPSWTRTITCNWTKTLLNTGNQAVPMPGVGTQTFMVFQGPAYASVIWAKAHVSYTGSGTANLGDGTINYTISGLTRNFNSSPEGYKYIKYVPSTNPYYSSMVDDPERHPFLSGSMTFQNGSNAQRQVDFGVGDVVDYHAKVTIKGITYDVDCRN